MAASAVVTSAAFTTAAVMATTMTTTTMTTAISTAVTTTTTMSPTAMMLRRMLLRRWSLLRRRRRLRRPHLLRLLRLNAHILVVRGSAARCRRRRHGVVDGNMRLAGQVLLVGVGACRRRRLWTGGVQALLVDWRRCRRMCGCRRRFGTASADGDAGACGAGGGFFVGASSQGFGAAGCSGLEARGEVLVVAWAGMEAWRYLAVCCVWVPRGGGKVGGIVEG